MLLLSVEPPTALVTPPPVLDPTPQNTDSLPPRSSAAGTEMSGEVCFRINLCCWRALNSLPQLLR
jgi:hypothetical protein